MDSLRLATRPGEGLEILHCGIKSAQILWALMALLVGLVHAGREVSFARLDPDDAASTARWLVGFSSWGVLSTISVHLDGSPWGNTASFSDGPNGNATGTPYFYLSALDPTPGDIELDARASLSLTEASLGTCGRDVEDPTCARLTLSGIMLQLSRGGREGQFALGALFDKHPEMRGWPKDHNWRIYKLQIQDIFLVDFYGGAKQVPVDGYYKAGESKNLYMGEM